MAPELNDPRAPLASRPLVGPEYDGPATEAPTADAEVRAMNGKQRLGSDHFRRQVVIVNEMGMHARPATLFVALASRYQAEVAIQKGGTQVDGKSILQLLSLAAEAGTPLVLDARGADAEAAVDALAELVATGFNELAPQDRRRENDG